MTPFLSYIYISKVDDHNIFNSEYEFSDGEFIIKVGVMEAITKKHPLWNEMFEGQNLHNYCGFVSVNLDGNAFMQYTMSSYKKYNWNKMCELIFDGNNDELLHKVIELFDLSTFVDENTTSTPQMTKINRLFDIFPDKEKMLTYYMLKYGQGII